MKIQVEFEGTVLTLTEENIQDLLEFVFMRVDSENKDTKTHARSIMTEICNNPVVIGKSLI